MFKVRCMEEGCTYESEGIILASDAKADADYHKLRSGHADVLLEEMEAQSN